MNPVDFAKVYKLNSGDMTKGLKAGMKSFPVGTVHNNRKKIQENPSKWVDLGSGKSYNSHNDENHHTAENHPQLRKLKTDALFQLTKWANSSDVKTAENLIESFLQTRVHAKNLQAHGDSLSDFHRASDEHHTVSRKLDTFLKQAKLRSAKGKSNG